MFVAAVRLTKGAATVLSEYSAGTVRRAVTIRSKHKFLEVI